MRVLMGDAGSRPIGLMIGMLVVATNNPLFLLLAVELVRQLGVPPGPTVQRFMKSQSISARPSVSCKRRSSTRMVWIMPSSSAWSVAGRIGIHSSVSIS